MLEQTAGPDFALRRSERNLPGAQVRVIATTGYQAALCEAVYPFQGLYEAHLMAWDPSVPDDFPRYVLPDVVTRHYGECQVLCESPEWVAHYEDFFKGAVRVHVCLLSENSDKVLEWVHKNKMSDTREPPPFYVPQAQVGVVARMNEALHSSMNQRMNGKHLTLGYQSVTGGV